MSLRKGLILGLSAVICAALSSQGQDVMAQTQAKRNSRGVVVRKGKGKRLTGKDAAEQDAAQLKALLTGKMGHRPDVVALIGVHPFAGGHVQHWRLRNGLNVLLAPDSASLVVAYHTWLSAGSRDEPANRGGIAHLLEHLMFKGTVTHPAGAFDRLLERHGASPNAATWLDFTMFHQAVPPETLPQVAALEADRLTGLHIDPVGLQAELEVVANERREQVDNHPDGALDEALYGLAYRDHPYGRPVLGSARDIGQLTRADVERFYDRFYHPSNATLVLVGAVEPVDAMKAVVDAYESVTVTVAPSEVQRPPLPAAVIDGPREATVVVDAHADRLLLGWLAVPGDDDRHPLVTIAAEVLAGAPSSRLQQALVRKGLAASVELDLPSLKARGLLELRVEAMPGVSAGTLRDVVMKQLKKLLTKRPITADEVAAARNRLRQHRYSELSTIDGRGEALGHAMAVFGDPGLPTRWWQSVQAARAEEVQAALAKILVPRNRVQLVGKAPQLGDR